jgi:hypothetical protein
MVTSQDRFKLTVVAMEFWAAWAWCVTMTNSNPLEGISFGVWLACSLALLPSRLKDWRAAATSAPIALFIGLCLFRFLSVTWGPEGVRPMSQLSRFIILPLMLWPLAASWLRLANAFIVGCIVAAVILLVRNIQIDGTRTYTDLLTHGKDIGMMCACFAQAFGLLLALGPFSVAGPLTRRLPLLALIGSAMVLCGQRTAALACCAALAALTIVNLVPGRSARHQAINPWKVIAAGALVVMTMVITNPRSREMAALWAQPSASTGARLSGDRMPLARGAMIIWLSHPIVGVGAGGFQPAFAQICRESPERLGISADRAEAFALLATAHNALMDELACRGVVGGLLLCGLLWTVAMASLRHDAPMSLAVGLAIWLAFSVTDGATSRGTHIAVLAVLATAAAQLRQSTPNAAATQVPTPTTS